MTREEAWNRIDSIIATHETDDVCVCLTNEKDYDALRIAREILKQEPCIQEKQANADKVDAVYIDGFEAGYSQARFDLEQEPCDCISRAEAQKRISIRLYESAINTVGYDCKTSDVFKDIAEKLSTCISEIPSIQPKPKTDVLDKIRAEIDRQQKWLFQAGYTTYNVDIAFDAMKAVVAESEDKG